MLKIGYFAWNSRAFIFVGRHCVDHSYSRIRYTPLGVPSNILVQLRKVKKHSSSNGCMSLQHRATFPRLIWCENCCFLVWNFRAFLVEKTLCVDHNDIGYSVRGTSNHPCTSNGRYETLKQQRMHVLTLHRATFQGWSVVQNCWFYLEFESLVW